MNQDKNKSAIGSTLSPDAAWLARQSPEAIIEPDLPIVDPHHHLWDRANHRYLLDELLVDTGSGHRVEATVFVECTAFYRAAGPTEMRPVGEAEFVNGVAAMSASGFYGPMQACAGIVGHADLLRGAAAKPVLQALIAAGNGRFRGIRHAGGWDASKDIRNSHTNPPQGVYGRADFREGFAQLAPLGLSFEAWQYHTQLPEVIDLARAFPSTSIILNHVGGPLGVGPYAGRTEETYAFWKRHIVELASCPNVSVKLGGLGMRIGMVDFHAREIPPSSAQIAEAWQPWVEPCIEAYGASRCMFESNFPVDNYTSSYAVLWNAFKRLAQGATPTEKSALFAGTARRVYRL